MMAYSTLSTSSEVRDVSPRSIVTLSNVTTPDTLWYQCSAHSGMLGQLNIVDKLSDTLQISGNNLIWNTLTIQSDTAIDLDDVSFVAIA